MADENTEINTDEGGSTDQSQSTGISQEQLDAAVQSAHDSAFAEARRMFQKSKPKPPRDEQQKSTKGNEKSEDRIDRRFSQIDALDDALADRKVTKEQRKMLRNLMEKMDPDEPAAWAESFVESFLASESSPETSTPETQPQDPQMPKPKAHVDGGAPSPLPVWERPTNPFEWSQEQVDALVAQKGQREAHRMIRQKAEGFARNMRIQLTKR